MHSYSIKIEKGPGINWVQNKPLTITWCVDVLKICHKDGWEITMIITWLIKKYSEKSEKRNKTPIPWDESRF